MQQIDEARLETDVVYRVGYVSEFMGFNDSDVYTIHEAAATRRHFVPRQSG